jgi:hypothetical protein
VDLTLKPLILETRRKLQQLALARFQSEQQDAAVRGRTSERARTDLYRERKNTDADQVTAINRAGLEAAIQALRSIVSADEQVTRRVQKLSKLLAALQRGQPSYGMWPRQMTAEAAGRSIR